MAGKHRDQRTTGGVVLSCVDVSDHTLPARRCRGWRERRWGCAGDTSVCVETQQCATNVILNPELHVLGIVFKKEKEL